MKYLPVLRVPWYFPFHPGVADYRRARSEHEQQPVCVMTGEPVTNANRFQSAKERDK